MLIFVLYFITAIFANEPSVIANEICTEFQFQSPFNPGKSCEEIYDKDPEKQNSSGYYWILSKEFCGMTFSGSSCEDIYKNYPETGDKPGYYQVNGTHWAYCNMTAIAGDDFIPTCAGVGGGWRRIANVNITAGDTCPGGWHKDTQSGVSFCKKSINGPGCNAALFSTNGIHYSKVCGRAKGYQKGHPWGGFRGYRSYQQKLDGYYVDGLSITYSSPRQHIWTYATGAYDNITYIGNCPCAAGGLAPPSFVGKSYYCESGRTLEDFHPVYHFDDPLWDGSGCITSHCCDDATQPWFYYELSGTTTSDIEARICDVRVFSDGFTMIDQLEIYIQ